MEFTDTLGKLNYSVELNSRAELTISQKLSLPIDFLASFVRNKREAELLLGVSKSATNLEQLMQNYEIIAFRSQELKEAWDGLWLSGEPYVAPAIPVIGTEMSCLNKGRCMLLEKISNEVSKLQAMGIQLNHYIDVNYSVVEELRMEGIDRLAVNKLHLVEVEKELARRIAYICKNESLREISSMREFLYHLSRSATSVSMTSDETNQSKAPVGNTTDGSCSTEKFGMDACSEHNAEKDMESPDSQSIASKCVATQADNMHRHTRLITSTKCNKQNYKECSSAGITSGKCCVGILHAVDEKIEVRNQSSSASEERLPKDVSAADGNNQSSKAETVNMHKSVNTNLDYADSSVKKLGVVLEVSKPELHPEQVQVSHREPADDKAHQNSTDQERCHPYESNVFSQAFQSLKIKHGSRKRKSESAQCSGDSVGGEMDIVKRNSKRVMVPGSFESGPIFARTDSLEAMEMLECHNTETNDEFDTASESKNDMSHLSCSCYLQKDSIFPSSTSTSHYNPLTHTKCKECGGWQSQSLIDNRINTVNRTSSCTFTEDRPFIEAPAIHLNDSPMLATQ